MKSRLSYTKSQDLSRISTQGVARELSRGYPNLELEKIADLTEYLKKLLHWNSKFNLIGTTDWKLVCHSLFLDSLQLRDFLGDLPLPSDPQTLDIGAGAGLPGIPLRLFWTEGRYTLVEPQHKKATFMNYILSHIQLPGTSVESKKIEDLYGLVQPVDLILSRAFRPWRTVLELASPLLQEQGLLVVLSNKPWNNDPSCPDNFCFSRQKEYTIPPGKNRYFWAFQRIIFASGKSDT